MPSNWIKPKILQKSCPISILSQSGRIVVKCPQQLSFTELEINPLGTPSGNWVWLATLEANNKTKANSRKHRPRHSHMRSYSAWKLHTQIGVYSIWKIPKYSKRSHLGNNMEIAILVKNLHFPLTSNSEQDLNLGQPQKMGIHKPLNISPLLLEGRNHGAHSKQLYTQWGNLESGHPTHETNQMNKQQHHQQNQGNYGKWGT